MLGQKQQQKIHITLKSNISPSPPSSASWGSSVAPSCQSCYLSNEFQQPSGLEQSAYSPSKSLGKDLVFLLSKFCLYVCSLVFSEISQTLLLTQLLALTSFHFL